MTQDAALYIVATPIGNLDDISYRAISVLKRVDIVAAEDKRHSLRLLKHLGIQAQLFTYNDHSSEAQSEYLLKELSLGKSVALISDAGTPLISDPGYRLVSLSRHRGIQVVPIPGASAPITALCASGLPTDRFTFEGFLPAKRGARITALESLRNEARTMVFFESPHRIEESIKDFCSIFSGTREASMARELTKTFETFLGSTLADIETKVSADKNQSKGEIVLMVRGANIQASRSDIDEDTERMLLVLLDELPLKQASNLAAKLTGVSKKKLYQYGVQLKNTRQ